MSRPRPCREEGVALVTVLMIVAAMSVAAVTLTSAVLSSTSRAKALDASAQADWLALAAEEYARLSIADMLAASEGKLFAGMPGLDTEMRFAVDGGSITITGHDASNCFNLNTLRTAAPDGQAEEDAGAPSEDFEQLAELAGLDGNDAQALAASLTDWMDRDRTPGLSGAEDGYYAAPGLGYRTSGQPLAELSELRAIRHVTPEIVTALEPLVCALPSAVPQTININTLSEAEAPLLSLALSGTLPASQARDVIFQRPPGGWESVEQFLALPAIASISPELRREDMLAVSSTHIDVRAVIDYRGTHRVVEVLFELDGTGPARTIRRERKA